MHSGELMVADVDSGTPGAASYGISANQQMSSPGTPVPETPICCAFLKVAFSIRDMTLCWHKSIRSEEPSATERKSV